VLWKVVSNIKRLYMNKKAIEKWHFFLNKIFDFRIFTRINILCYNLNKIWLFFKKVVILLTLDDEQFKKISN